MEKNTWIEEAELYFDNRDVMHVTVTEKEPVARVFRQQVIPFTWTVSEENCPCRIN
ncbi:MAG: hypothetical protein IPP43_13305 [Chitinophagaceae bacterium]|nr:hypothetical protein [Chitinophagaceae bacterium]